MGFVCAGSNLAGGVTLEPRRAALRHESAACALYHRDIALLYASAD
ncbi:hypothetical protein EIO_1955 [Ketogulonicigenium vulgare Y25]|uniref:Uncharacterized protein n=1 Tax=Ketogulonicigenium vulgare (strain WSH-001) TaxID=759362 RepID=F9Y8S9_KETVW|nr:hypothetical protein EIO_1955 [Ketogulonicigenium vulgare Y25]AEM41248.1 hypothetical protein KVU_1409 [Ketogulonicigenium vulgare WSH-001]ALJ81389.1 hypothetical protein KVH_09465 [Ketogulonicigenium vulgare]AOZ54983.1 hypothetical protein KVC_1976 [Ketogulonicigenium vulgare]